MMEDNVIDRLTLLFRGAVLMYLFVSSMYYLRYGKDRARVMLGITFLFLFVNNVRSVSYPLFGIQMSDNAIYASLIVDWFSITFINMFLIEVVSPRWLNWRRIARLFWPNCAYLLVYLLFPGRHTFNILVGVFICFSIYLYIRVMLSVPKVLRRLKQMYSNTEYLHVEWLWSLIAVFFLLYVAWIVFMVTNIYRIKLSFYIFECVAWFIICYYVHRYQESMRRMVGGGVVSPIIPSDDFNVQHRPRIYEGFDEKLRVLFEEKQLYLNPSLTLSDLAKQMNTNRSYISSYINVQLDTTFYDFVNSYRLRHAAQLLTSHHEMTIADVAEQSGFNSLSTFRRSFSKHYGCTPIVYRNNNLE